MASSPAHSAEATAKRTSEAPADDERLVTAPEEADAGEGDDASPSPASGGNAVAEVRHWDAEPLLRPQTPSKGGRLYIAALAVVAVVVGGVLLFQHFDTTYHAAARSEATVQENLSRDVSLDLPFVASLVVLDDATVASVLQEQGYPVYVASSSAITAGADLDIIKLPSDVPLEEAALMYLAGVGSMSAEDASRILNGSWRLTCSRIDTTSMRVSYVDFDNLSLETAVNAAIAAQAFDPASVTDSGVDESGNTYSTGTIALANGAVGTWRVSAIALSSVYSIDGLPDTAIYVGIRVTY